jgi:hypothetical protein
MPRGWTLSTATASHKIDLTVALAMSCHAAVTGQSNGGARLLRYLDALNRDPSLPGGGSCQSAILYALERERPLGVGLAGRWHFI